MDPHIGFRKLSIILKGAFDRSLLKMSRSFLFFFFFFIANSVCCQPDEADKGDPVNDKKSLFEERSTRIGVNSLGLLGARISLSYQRDLNKWMGIKASIGRRFISNDIYGAGIARAYASLLGGFQNVFRNQGAIELHFYLTPDKNFRPYLSLSGGGGNAKVSYVDYEVICPGPSGCSACCHVTNDHRLIEASYWYVGFGGGFEFPIAGRISFFSDLELGMLSLYAADVNEDDQTDQWGHKDRITFPEEGFAWFSSLGIAYHF